MQPNREQIDKAINTIKGKMKVTNFNNMKPPYFLHTVTKFRETYFSQFIKDINLEGKNQKQVFEKLKTLHYIIENFDDDCFDLYTGQLIEPYTRKMFQDNYGFDQIDFKEANTHYHLRTEIQETLSAAAEWLTQIEITQDLLSRIELYFKISTPHVIEKVRQSGYQSQKNTWGGTFVSYIKKLISYSLRKGSKIVQTTFWSAMAPTAIMLTLAIMGGTATIPWKTTFNINSLIPAVAVIAVPYALDSMADTVDRSDCSQTLRRWAVTFSQLSENITKFNECLDASIRNCTTTKSVDQFEKERTNLQKIIYELNKNITTVTTFSEEKLEEMRERTEAYFKKYIEIEEEGWTLIIPEEERERIEKGKKESEEKAKEKEKEVKKQKDEQEILKQFQ